MRTDTEDSATLRLPRLQAVTLARFVLGFVALAAAAGWAASFVGLHGFALTDMHGYTQVTAWLVPGSFDGAAFACSVLVYRASIFGRSALRGRVLMYGFTLLSGWINWHFQTNVLGQWVAAALPFAAVAVFDTVLGDLRAEWEEKHGRKAFRLRLGLLGLRWAVDRTGTWGAFRDTLKAVPVTDLVGLGNLTGAVQDRPGPSETGTADVAPRPWTSDLETLAGEVHQALAPRPYSGPVPPVTAPAPAPAGTGTGASFHPFAVDPDTLPDWHPASPRHHASASPSGDRSVPADRVAPVPVVTQPQPVPRDFSAGAGPMTGGTGTGPTTRPVPPESPAEQTMVMPRIRPDEGPEQRTKVTPPAVVPAASGRRLVSVTAPRALGAGSRNAELAAAVAAAGGMSRRAVMTTYGVGSGRATKIIELANERGNDHGEASSTR